MRQILHWPHWQVFLITLFIPLALFVAGLYEVTAEQPLFGDVIFEENKFFIFLSLITSVTIAIWLWVVGTSLYPKLPDDTPLDINLFHFGVWFPVVYEVATIVLQQIESSAEISVFGFFLTLLNCVNLCFTIFVFHFIAKGLRSVELERRARFGDYIGTFLLTLFMFIGIWFIQPRINEVFKEEDEGLEKHLIT